MCRETDNSFASFTIPSADDDSIRVVEIINGMPFSKKFGIRDYGNIVAIQHLFQEGRCSYRGGRFLDQNAPLLQGRPDFSRGIDEGVEIG